MIPLTYLQHLRKNSSQMDDAIWMVTPRGAVRRAISIKKPKKK